MAGFARGVLGGATGGMSRLAQALMSGQQAQQMGFDQELGTQTKLAAALAQLQGAEASGRAHDAQALHATAQADKVGQEADVLRRRPGIADLAMASQAGVDVPTLNAYRTKLQTGQAPAVPMGPPADDGSMGVGSAQFGPATASKIAQALVQLGPVLNAEKDINPDQYAKALGQFRAQVLGDQVLNGERTAGAVGAAQAAIEGKPLKHFDASGMVGDLFSGVVDVSNPMAQGSITLKREQAGAQKANAVQSYAAAGASNASAAKARAETGQIVNGPKGVLVQTDAGPVFADPRTGQAVPVLGADGQPAGAKLKPIPPAVNTAIITNAQNISKVEQALALLEGNKVGALQGSKDATGWKGYLPNAILNRVDSDGTDTRAMISDIGSLVLHDRSGAAVTASETPRLLPFIPLATDDPQTAKRKLTRFLQVYKQEQEGLTQTYSKEQGYQPSPVKPATPEVTAPGAGPAAFADPSKEARYQAWKAQQQGQR